MVVSSTVKVINSAVQLINSTVEVVISAWEVLHSPWTNCVGFRIVRVFRTVAPKVHKSGRDRSRCNCQLSSL